MTDFTSGYTTLLKKQWRALVYDYDAMRDGIGDGSKLYCLTNFQAMWLQQNVDYMRWSTRWNNLSIDKTELGILADDLELALMSCIDLQIYQIEYGYKREVEKQLELFNTLYDSGGIPELNPNTPTDFFNGDDSDSRNLALCSASNIYIKSYASNWINIAQITLGLVSIVGIVASISIVGGIIATLLVGGLAFITQIALDAMSDESALDNVICCMRDGLLGTAVSQANFITSLDACGFSVGSNESIIRDIIVSDIDQWDNYLSFLNSLGDSFVLSEVGIGLCTCDGVWTQSYLGIFGSPVPDGWIANYGSYNSVTREIDGQNTGSSWTIEWEYVLTETTTITQLKITGNIVQIASTRNQYVSIEDDFGTVIVNEVVNIDSTPNAQNFTVDLTGISQIVHAGWKLIFGGGAVRTTSPETGESHTATVLINGTGTSPF